jgi:Rho GDP-dissociation inhibitor
MSLAVGVVSSSKIMGYDEKTNEGEEHSEASKTLTTAKTATDEENDSAPGGLVRRMSESSIYATDQEDEDDEGRKIELGPQYTLKEQFEKDKVCFYSYLNNQILCFWAFSIMTIAYLIFLVS